MKDLAVTFAIALVVGALPACSGSDAKPRDLEVGIRGPEGEFVPLEEEGILLLEPDAIAPRAHVALRAAQIDPYVPAPSAQVRVSGKRVASRPLGERHDMEHDGVGYVLWDVPIAFEVETCCYLCRDGKVVGGLVDRDDHEYEGQATVLLTFGDCPAPDACCESADTCPDPAMTQLCE